MAWPWKDKNLGYNARTDNYEDLVKAGVIDPTKVTGTRRTTHHHEGGIMPRMTSCPASRLPLFLLLIGNAGPLLSQSLEKPPPDYRSPTVVEAVASLNAEGGKNGIWLGWPPAAGASEYWVERTDNKSGTVETIVKGPSTMFTFEGSDCSLTAHFKNCQYTDRKLIKNQFYSYRVWTGGGQSPVAHARAQCSWGQAESKPRTNPPTYVWGCW